MTKKKISKCIACGRLVEWKNWAAGPVCYPCYWGAKLYHENGIHRIEDLPPPFDEMLSQMLEKGNYLWPDDLIKVLETKPFDKCDTSMRRWWSPKGGLGDKAVRDPDAPCLDFDPSMSGLGDMQQCETDGHYLCRACKWKVREPDEKQVSV